MLKQSHYTIGCDAHKHYSLFAVVDDRGKPIERTRVNHEPGAIRAFPRGFRKGRLSPWKPWHAVAVGSVARYLAEATFWVLKKGEP